MTSLGAVKFGYAVMWTATIATHCDRSHRQQHDDLMAVIQTTIKGGWLGRRGIIGTARVIESERTAAGWHVHAHVLLVSRNEFDRGEARAFALDLRTRYLAEAERLGVRASTAGQRVEKAKRVSDLVDYITKSRVRPGGTDAPSALWNAVGEGDGDALALIHDLEAGTFRRRQWTTTGVCRPLTPSR